MKLANPKSKHIAKAAQGYASTKALSKSLLFHPKKKNKKISPASQKLNQLKHKQTDQNNLTIKEAKQLANNEIYTDEQGTTTHNRRLAQWRVTWLIEHSTSHQLLWCIDSFVLRNPPLRQAPKRCIELCKLLRYPKGFSASKGIVDIFGGASRPSSLGGETVQVRSIPLVDVSETSQRLDEVSRYQPHNQVLTDKKQKIITTWLWLLADFSATAFIQV